MDNKKQSLHEPDALQTVFAELADPIVTAAAQAATLLQGRLDLVMNGLILAEQKKQEALTKLFREIVAAVGVERFAQIPLLALEQYALMTVAKNHDTKGLLVSLLNSFMVTYLTPETHQRAYAILESLEALRTEVSAAQSSPKKQFRAH